MHPKFQLGNTYLISGGKVTTGYDADPESPYEIIFEQGTEVIKYSMK